MKLFAPFNLKGCELKNRIVKSATLENMATLEGLPTDGTQQFYERLARGGARRGWGGGMQGRMRESMEHQGVGMMHGMSDKPGGGMIMADDHPMRKHLMLLGLDEKQQESLLAQRYQAYRGEIQVTHEVI